MVSVVELNAYFGSLEGAILASRRELSAGLGEFYIALSRSLALLRECRKELAARLAPDFNVFAFLRPDENAISRIVADLLNPEGAHGQGSLFLREFAALIGHGGVLAGNDVAVVRQQDPADWIDARGYIDIVVEIGGFAIGIENKPFAVEQDDQLRRYCEHMGKKYGDRFCMVFLSGVIQEPESIAPAVRRQLESEGKFKVLMYREFNAWLQGCAARSAAPRVGLVLEDLRSYFRMAIPGLGGEEAS